MALDSAFNINREPEDSGFSLKEILSKYTHFWWVFCLTIGVAISLAWLYMRYTQPVYSVSSTLLIRNDNMNRGGNNAMNSQDMFSDIALFQSNSNKQNEILIHSSRTMMERVVKSLGLERSYSVVGKVKTTNIYPEQPFEIEIINLSDSSGFVSYELHFSADWKTFRLGDGKEEYFMGQEIETTQGKFKFVPRSSSYSGLSFRNFIVKYMPLKEAAISYGGGLDVKPANDLSNVLMLTYTNENPYLSTAILNELMAQYNNAAIEDKNEINRKILSFINDRINLVESQLDSVEGNLQLYRTSNDVIDLSTQSTFYFENISDLKEKVRTQEVQLQVAQIIEDYLSQPSNRLSLVPSTLGLADQTLLSLTVSYNELVNKRILELQTGATVNNPVIKNLEIQIESARVKMIQSLANIKQTYKNNIAKLASESGSLKKEISSIPARERANREKARQQEIKQNLYLYLMQKREESEISQASTISNSRTLDTALPIFNRVSPIPVKIYGIAFALGLLLPILIIYVKDILNDKVTTKADIAKVTSAPILAEIGHSDEDKVLLFPESSRKLVAEQIRILRSNLKFVIDDKSSSSTIVVTSSFSGEGKSFISTNLGAAMALSGKRTIILEFDLRKPKIVTGLGLQKGQGLTNYLVGNSRLEELPIQVPQFENLFVIPCGPVPPNPSEMLLSPKIAELFAWLKKTFEIIVIDTAPLGLVSDSFTFSEYADATIYVIRQRYTFKKQIHFIDELYRQKKMPGMGLVVNDVVAEGAKGYYGYGGRYGYGYGYGMANGYYDVSVKGRFSKLFRKS